MKEKIKKHAFPNFQSKLWDSERKKQWVELKESYCSATEL